MVADGLKNIFRASIALVLIAFPGVSSLVYAADILESPESITVSDIKVFRNLAESGDILYVFQYDIAYASDNYPAR